MAMRLVSVLACCLIPLLAGCDSGFVKAGEPEPEPEPESEPAAEPEVVLDAAVDAAAPETFFVPAATPSELDGASTVSELEGGELTALCEAEQARLTLVVDHYSEESELCRILSVLDAAEDVTSDLAFRSACNPRLEECVEEGPDRELDSIIAPVIAEWSCDQWSAGGDCDPTLEEVEVCLSDLVENLSARLFDLGDCTSGRVEAQVASDEVTELGVAGTPFVTSNRCGDVACLLGATADAGP